MQIHELTALARQMKASDIHLSEGLPLMFRVDGRKDMRQTNGTFKYALKYFRKHALCVLWRVPEECVGRHTARWRFRAPAKRIIDLQTEEIKPDRLFLWGEDVRYCVIPFRRLPEFLARYREELG